MHRVWWELRGEKPAQGRVSEMEKTFELFWRTKESYPDDWEQVEEKE